MADASAAIAKELGLDAQVLQPDSDGGQYS